MPAIGNIVVKDNDNTTDRTYTAQSGSGGDKSPAIWQRLDVGAAPGFMPTVTMVAQWNGPKTLRRTETEYVWPLTGVDSSGRTSVISRMIFRTQLYVPIDMPVATRDSSIAQALNLMPSMKFGFQGGYAFV